MKLTPDETDVLKELINIGVGKAASILNQMTGFHIHLEVPDIKITWSEELRNVVDVDPDAKLSTVSLGFFGRFSGTSAIVFPPESANLLVATLVGEDPDSAELDELRVGMLNEVGNIVINGVMGSIGNILSEYINYTTPTYVEDSMLNLLTQDATPGHKTMVLIAKTRFVIQERNIEGDIVLIFNAGSFDTLLACIHEKMLDEGE